MKILVINRIDDPACAEAMRMIPGAEVRVVSETDHDACQKASVEFSPYVIVVSDPTDPKGINSVYHEYSSGLRIWHPWSVLMRESPYNLFIKDKKVGSGIIYVFAGITDLNKLAVKVVEESMPEVSILITDPDEAWQGVLKRKLGEILGVTVSVYNGSAHIDDAALAPDIAVIDWNWSNISSYNNFSNLIKRIKDPIDLKIAVFSGTPERNIITQGPSVDFVLCKESPVNALTLMVEHWTKQIQARKRDELCEGLLRNQSQTRVSR